MPDPNNIFKEIVDAEQTFVDLYNYHDAPQVTDLYTEDAQILPPNMDVVSGAPQLEALFRGFWAEGFTVMELKTIDVGGSADLAFEVGTYKLTGTRKGDAVDLGKYIVIWKKLDGKWKLYRDIFNSSLPAAPAGEQTK